MAYDKNFSTAMFGHFNIDNGGDVDKRPTTGRSRTSGDETADIRDILTGIVGKGYTNFSDPDAQHNFAVLAGIVGKKEAQELITHAFIFNQRPDVQHKTASERITQFYDMGSSNPGLNTIIKAAGNFSRGPLAGARESADMLNRQVTGRDDLSPYSTDVSQVNKVKDMASQTIK